VPVIASGGAGRLAHFAPAVAAGAGAVLAASTFHFGGLAIADVKESLRQAGYPVRSTPRSGPPPRPPRPSRQPGPPAPQCRPDQRV
jgi:imidazole glycerol-phosphate synthase subunit HisF